MKFHYRLTGFIAMALLSAGSAFAAPGGNPIRAADTADPGVLYEGGKWYVTHTSSGRHWENRYPVLTSTDLVNWKDAGYIFPADLLPKWGNKSSSWWAPEIHKVGNRYVAYFTIRQNSNNRFAIGAATAPRPDLPYTDVGKPIVINPDVGLIDVTYYKDPNTQKQYLIWKEDQNDFNPPRPTPLIMSEMTTDGLGLVGKPKELLRNDQKWEGVLVEAPSLIHHGDWYYLFYSANGFASDEYAVGVARSKDIWGPYEKFPKQILTSDKNFSGPGHQYVIQDDKGAWHMFYHARIRELGTGHRFLMHDLITWGADGWPKVNDGHPGGPLNQKVLEEARDYVSGRKRKK